MLFRSVYNLTEDQTLYAQWRELIEIPETFFDFGEIEEYTYERIAWDVEPTARETEYTYNADVNTDLYQIRDTFTFQYIAQGYENEGYVDAPAEAGTWNVLVTRPADDTYAKFEQLYENVVIINKGQRTIHASYVAGDANLNYPSYGGETYSSYSYVGVRLLQGLEGGGWNYDADPDLKIRFSALPHGTTDKIGRASCRERV